MLGRTIVFVCLAITASGSAQSTSPAPANDNCAGSFNLELDEVILGFTSFASVDSAPECGTASESNSPGVWYTTLGTGNTLEASTCSPVTSFDTQISIFQGDCDAITCVGGNDDACESKSSVRWQSKFGSVYYILVHGYAFTEGEFEISVKETEPRPGPDNDLCENSQELLLNSLHIGSTNSASVDDVQACGPSSPSTAPGVWYYIVGTGTPLEASLCGDTTTFDTQISVFSGNCGDLNCVAGNDDDPQCDIQSTVTWVAAEGSLYYILVHGYDYSFGEFEIRIKELTKPTNDNCVSAQSLPLNKVVEASTTTASAESVNSCGSSKASTSPGVWFSVVGTGNPLKASTCNLYTKFDTQVSIFSGDCESGLFCVDGNDDACGFQSLVGWQSEADTIYYILVHAFGPLSGDFGIVIEEVSAPLNDDCNNAQAFPLNTMDIGSTVLATHDNVDICNGISETNAPGVWYVITGRGRSLQATTCTDVTEFDTQISVFAGDCTELQCITGNDQYCGDRSFVVWEAVMDIPYYILVHGYANSTGSFGLSIEEYVENPGPINDACNDAVAVEVGELAFGSTFLATTDNVNLCGGASMPMAPGVWFKVRGKGNAIQASTCGSSDFDTQISIFTGSCEGLICLDGNDDFCGVQSQIRWDTEQNSLYFILVHGFTNSTGEFGIMIEEFEGTSASTYSPTSDYTIENARCPGALQMEAGSYYEGSTALSIVDIVSACGRASRSTAPGLWFSIQGSGATIQASTCGSSIDTQISVFSGECDSLICVAGNDDQCGFQSTTAWKSEVNVTYNIYVHGYAESVGSFILSVDEVVTLTNDECVGASALLIGGVEKGSTVTAALDNVDGCGDATATTSPGVWFVVVGNGNTLQASTCGSSYLDTQISVFVGNCNELQCLTGNDQHCGDQSSVSWESEADAMYYILVHGFGDLVGAFDIDLKDLTEVSNDDCKSAIAVTINAQEVLGSTLLATTDPVEACGGSTDGTAPGVWFKVTGTGNLLHASTCGPYTTFDTQISIFAGGCESLSCIVGNNDWCGRQSHVNWQSEVDSIYYILVHGYNDAAGSFGILVEEVDRANDNCFFATELSLNDIIESSTNSAHVDAVPACGDATEGVAPGLWYSVVGTGNTLQTSTCALSAFDTQISVFEGECNVLSCVNGNDDFCNTQSLVAWSSEVDVVYYILVHGFGNAKGDFGIVVEELDAPRNDRCRHAVALSMGITEFGTTVPASVDSAPSCGNATQSTSAGVWFVVLGTGNVVEASTCNPATSFDTQLSVYEGSCRNLVCVTGNDQFCGDRSLVRWVSEQDSSYYILVHGYGTSVGEFGVLVEEPTPPPNDNCGDSIALGVGQSVVSKTLMATIDSVDACGTSTESRTPGVWFSILGTGKRLQASTCDSTDFDTQISVFQGECGDLQCVDGNDDECGVQSAIGWESQVDSTYFVLVHGFGISVGHFVIEITEMDETEQPPMTPTEQEGTEQPVAEQPAEPTSTVTSEPTSETLKGNDMCIDALPLPPGSVMHSSTLLATVDRVTDCGGASASTAPGVWFLVEGTGALLRATTCGLTSLDTQISVFHGGCDDLQCEGGNDDWCGSQSTISWDSKTDVTYYILVHGFADAKGDFGIIVEDAGRAPTVQPVSSTSTTEQPVSSNMTDYPTVQPFPSTTDPPDETMQPAFTEMPSYTTTVPTLQPLLTDAPTTLTHLGTEMPTRTDNLLPTDKPFATMSPAGVTRAPGVTEYSCENPLSLELGTTDLFSTVFGAYEDVEECGKASSSTSPGVWFMITGTGNILQASTCDSETTFDTQISIFTGDCNHLICVNGNDDKCGLQSTITWNSDADDTYFILVHGFGLSSGIFSLSIMEITENVTPTNNLCDDAVALVSGGRQWGSTFFATTDAVEECGSASEASSPGVWYLVMGTGEPLIASTCGYSTFDTQISVFDGTCDQLSCVTGNDQFCGDQSLVLWQSEADKLYYILIHGFRKEKGEFGIVIGEQWSG